MKIADIYMPAPGPNKTAEETIVVYGAYPLLEEIRQIIFGTKVHIVAKKTSHKGKGGAKGATGNIGLTPKINKHLGYGLAKFGWAPHYAEKALNKNKKIDWFKTTPDPYWSQRGGGIGIGVETQFGNNFQAHGDLQRLQSAFNTHEIAAGLIIVPSDELSKYLADRCANFSNTKSKLEQQIDTMLGARAFNICPIGIIGVNHDGFVEDADGGFLLESQWKPEDADDDAEDEADDDEGAEEVEE